MNILWKIKSPLYHFFRSVPGIAWILDQEKKNLSSLIRNEDFHFRYILDIGTGTGSSLDIFPETMPVIAVDCSIHMLRQASKRRTALLPVAARAEALPFKSSVFEFVSCIGVAEYFPDPGFALQQMSHVLFDSGRLLITLPEPSVFNRLRVILGHRLYLNGKTWAEAFCDAGFSRPGGTRFSWLQKQQLMYKNAKINE